MIQAVPTRNRVPATILAGALMGLMVFVSLVPVQAAPEDRTGFWNTHTSETTGVSIRYPDQVRLESERGDTTRFILWGDTQEPAQTFYDGVWIELRAGNTNGKSFRDFSRARVEELKADPLVKRLKNGDVIEIDGEQGYVVDVSGLPTARYILVPRGEGQYLEVMIIANDPEGKGYADIVNGMVASIQLP